MQLHNYVHTYVGDETNMGTIPFAAADPIFWLHHCNIDRLWAAWNASGGQNPVTINGANWADIRFVFANAEGERVETSISNISDSNTLTYRYDTLPDARPGSAIASGGSTGGGGSVLLKSVTLGAASTASNTSARAAPVTLGWEPVKIILVPTAPQNALSVVTSRISRADPSHLILLLRDVTVQLNPRTAYQVFLNLPENASDDLQDKHYVGLLVFFGVETSADHDHRGGRDFEFDVTDLVKTLGTGPTLRGETFITIVPMGAPTASSRPTISGGIELQRR
jgi:tyrosinase